MTTLIHTPVTRNFFQVSTDTSQTQSAQTVFEIMSPQDEEYYYSQQNYCVGQTIFSEDVPDDIIERLYNEGGVYDWQSCSDTRTWETYVSEHITINGECVWENFYTYYK